MSKAAITRSCPECGGRLQFRDRFPVLSNECSLTEADNHNRLRYIAVWLCEAKGCDYCEAASESKISNEGPLVQRHI